MRNKLIDLNALSSYKTQSDLKYQDKLTAGTNITINGNTISATGTLYQAGASISINNGVISATPVFENGHNTYIPGNQATVPAGTTANIYTAVRNCKFYFSIQVQGTTNTAKNTKVYINSLEVFSQYAAPSLKYTRIMHGALLLSAGDVVSVENQYGFDFEIPISIFYE